MTSNFRTILIVVCLLFAAVDQVYSQEDPPEPVGARLGEGGTRSTIVPKNANAPLGKHEQIKVTGGTPFLRSVFFAFASELRRDFRWTIYRGLQTRAGGESQRNAWSIPIQVDLWGSGTDVYRGKHVLMGVELLPDNRFHLSVSARLNDRFDEDAFRVELIRTFLVEQVLMPYVVAPQAMRADEIKIPEWLVHGFDEKILHRRSGGRSALYQGILKSGRYLTPQKLFEVEDPYVMDPISYAIFRLSASSMVSALLDQKEGDAGVREMLGDLGAKSNLREMALLKKHFPEFRELDQGLDKWWTLQVATMGQQQRFEFLDRVETDQWLTEALMVRLRGTMPRATPVDATKPKLMQRLKAQMKKSGKDAEVVLPAYQGSIGQYTQFIDRKDAKEGLMESHRKLQQLKVFGFPLYRPLFERYEQVIGKLLKGRTKEIDQEIAEIESLRAVIKDTLEKSEDYLNHYEAARSPYKSDVFENYQTLRRDLERRELPKRKDAITQYMDSIEREFR